MRLNFFCDCFRFFQAQQCVREPGRTVANTYSSDTKSLVDHISIRYVCEIDVSGIFTLHHGQYIFSDLVTGAAPFSFSLP